MRAPLELSGVPTQGCAASAGTSETPSGASVPRQCGHLWNCVSSETGPKGALRCGWVGNKIPGGTRGLDP
eukprot:15463001-Alexandrium_andersonii.AAC.1